MPAADLGFSPPFPMSTLIERCVEFATEAVRNGNVLTLSQKGIGICCSRTAAEPRSGSQALPFWSSAERVESIRATDPEFRDFEIREIRISSFLKYLGDLNSMGIRVGVNLSPQHFTEHLRDDIPLIRIRQETASAGVLRHQILLVTHAPG
jgi:hypothetical protein